MKIIGNQQEFLIEQTQFYTHICFFSNLPSCIFITVCRYDSSSLGSFEILTESISGSIHIDIGISGKTNRRIRISNRSIRSS